MNAGNVQRVSDDSLLKATGKSWAQWFVLLSKLGADEIKHKEIARRLSEDYGVDGWWAQTITVEFEREIGRRVAGQVGEGDFQAGASKTVPGTPDEALAAWLQLVKNARAFNEVAFEAEPSISKTEKWRYWRVSLTNKSKVTIVIGAKDAARSIVAVSHEKLTDVQAVETWKGFWKEFLGRLTASV